MTRFTAILLIFSVAAGQAAPLTGDGKVLRYVSQRTDKAYLREGPTYAHKVLWQYRHRGYPFAVIAEFDTWRRVRAADGTVGWMAASMLIDQRTVLVTGKGRAKIFANAEGGKLVALADPGAVASLKACTLTACHIKGDKTDGWIARDRIWGVEPNEVFDKLPAR
ncbi:MAG: bacterial domain protein [Alphaproteobacteria bacterium]|nr:bacterial domain protein [Alphaproteobacteria bacterium]